MNADFFQTIKYTIRVFRNLSGRSNLVGGSTMRAPQNSVYEGTPRNKELLKP